MPIVYRDKEVSFNIYKYENGKYELQFQYVYEDVVSATTSIKKDECKLEITLKYIDNLSILFSENNVYLIERVVINEYNPNIKAKKLFILFDSTFTLSENGEQTITLTALDLTFLKSQKFIGTTTNTIVTDPENIPDSFYKYRDSSKFNTVIKNLYTRVFVEPQTLAYGQKLQLDVTRKLLGIGNINVPDISNESKTLSYDAGEKMYDVENKIKDLFNIKYRSELVIRNGSLDIDIIEPYTVSMDLFSQPNEVKSLSYKMIKSNDYANLFHATANPNIYSTSKDISKGDITTIEKSEDVSFTAGDNQTYTDNAAVSGLKKNNEPLNFDLQLKFTNLMMYIDYNLYDIVKISGFPLFNGQYEISEITETIETDNINVVVKLTIIK